MAHHLILLGLLLALPLVGVLGIVQLSGSADGRAPPSVRLTQPVGGLGVQEAGQNRKSWLTFGFMAVSLPLVSGAFAAWLGRRLSSELADLVDRARKVSRGETPVARSFGAREFNEVAEALTVTAGERGEAEDRVQFLIQELQHRTNNLLAVVSSIADHTLVKGRPVAEARDVFLGRLHALANAGATLAQTNWKGADIAMLIDNEMNAVTGRYSISGPTVLLSPSLTQTVSLLIHELATNARRHGALSKASGTIAISWQLTKQHGKQQLEFEWVERGGPPAAPPERRGFGCTLLQATLTESNPPTLTFDEQGFTYRAALPLDDVLPEAA